MCHALFVMFIITLHSGHLPAQCNYVLCFPVPLVIQLRSQTLILPRSFKRSPRSWELIALSCNVFELVTQHEPLATASLIRSPKGAVPA
jgi:hypothetical protein